MSAAPSHEPAQASLPAPLDQLAATGVGVAHPDEVCAYLAQHPDVAGLLVKACERARLEFPANELVLTVNHDPEIDDPYLMLYVRQWPYPPDILQRLNAVWDPFEDLLSQSSGWLVISTDFRKPESSSADL